MPPRKIPKSSRQIASRRTIAEAQRYAEADFLQFHPRAIAYLGASHLALFHGFKQGSRPFNTYREHLVYLVQGGRPVFNRKNSDFTNPLSKKYFVDAASLFPANVLAQLNDLAKRESH